METKIDSKVEALLADLHRMAAEGVYVAATRVDNIRWTAVLAKVKELENELAAAR